MELQNRAVSFIRVEEGHDFQRGQREEVVQMAKSNRGIRDERRAFRREEGGIEKKSADLPKVPQYVHYTPLNAPRVRVMEKALRADLWTLTQSPTSRGADE